MGSYPSQGNVGPTIENAEIAANAVDDSKIASHASTKITGLPTQTSDLDMGTKKIFHSTIIAIVANVTQTQGQSPLTAEFNEIGTVANEDDVVTLPTAVKGAIVMVDNDGANTLQIFPASGDNLGNGVDVSIQLETGGLITFNALDATNWDVSSNTIKFHAEIHDEDNSDAFVINDAGADPHCYHSNGLVKGDVDGWTYDAGGAGTSFPIASIADATGGKITVTTTGTHGLAVGDIISQTNLANSAYVGIFVVLTVPTTTTYTVTAAFTATGTGTMDQAATLSVNDIAVGAYAIDYSLSNTTATNNETIDFEIYKNASKVIGTKRTSKFGTGGDFRAVAGCGIVEIASGDKISLVIENQDSGGDITIEDVSIRLIRL